MHVSQRGDGKLVRARHSYCGNIQTNNVCIGHQSTVYVYQGERIIFVELIRLLKLIIVSYHEGVSYSRALDTCETQRGHVFPHFTSIWGLSERQQLISMQWIWGY